MSFINKKDLFGNNYNACALCEYRREVKLIKRLINISEKAVEKKSGNYTWSYEGICYSFAKTIVDYSKMAYDNVLLGHFHAVKMINRAILENLVCLDIIVNNDELWKYYWAYSYRSTIYKSERTPTQDELNRLQELYDDLQISEDFYIKQGDNKKAYIQKPYGWTYKINHNKQFTFENVCKLVDDSAEYHGFSLMSDYAHGTSFYTKMHSSVFVGDMMIMFVNLYMNLYRMVTMYCWDNVDEAFDDVTDELESIFYRFIKYEEENFGNTR
jgi:hypothetical protein